MKKIFEEFGVNLNEEQIEKFEKYYALLVETNAKFNITAITEKKEVAVKHFIDSIFYTKWICGNNLIDIGSGGGFPAIPLKIVNENLSVCMLEATGKKCEFLYSVIKELNLTDVKVINGRAEELAFDKNYRESFDMCTARAVARYNILAEYCMPFVKVGGKFVAYKGDAEEELKEGQKAITALGGKLVEDYKFEIYGYKREIISVEKIKNTDLKYPRKNGVIRKKPL